MARIYAKGKWFEQVEPSTFSETEFEDRVNLHANRIYPHYHVVQFKKPLLTPDETKESGVTRTAADLAFISRDYKEWCVVEIEMGYHSLEKHIRPQLNRLLYASYGNEEAIYLSSKHAELDLPNLTTMVRSSPMRLLLIVNQNRPDWIRALSSMDVVVAVFELFRADDGEEVFRVNGEYPTMLEYVSACSFHKTVPRLLGIEQPDRLELPDDNGVIKLLYNSCLTEWRRVYDEDNFWLTAMRRNPLNSKHRYEVWRQNDGQLVLRRSL